MYPIVFYHTYNMYIRIMTYFHTAVGIHFSFTDEGTLAKQATR